MKLDAILNNNTTNNNSILPYSALSLNGKNKKISNYDVSQDEYNTLPIHIPFEVVQIGETGELKKLAYNKVYDADMPDLNIELDQIRKYERYYKKSDQKIAKLHKARLIFHYKKAVVLISPTYAEGWNKWSDLILELFVSDKKHRVLWGSGNCGKSAIFGLLLYIQWRVNPSQRMCVLATRVMKDAGPRVFGYITNIHAHAPADPYNTIVLKESNKEKAIYCKIKEKSTGRYITDPRACIILMPIKVSAKNEDIGSNLLGKHPQDLLSINFDEGQELLGNLLKQKIFLNWYTNDHLEVNAWGNPSPVDWNNKEDWDILFVLGAGFYSYSKVRELQAGSHRTGKWGNKNTEVLHLCMLDSPKDDPLEKRKYHRDVAGNKHQRLQFLAGEENVKLISEHNSPNSPEYFSQVLGFPYIDFVGTRNEGVITPYMVRKSKQYPLHWSTPDEKLVYFMGVDVGTKGYGDPSAICIGRMGMMVDGRLGVDLMNGTHCFEVKPNEEEGENEDYVDTTVKTIYEYAKKFNITLNRIVVETHGSGDSVRYALNQHISDNDDWPRNNSEESYQFINPSQSVTDRYLFKTIGKLLDGTEIVYDFNSEMWVAVRCAFLSRQIFNVPEDICRQYYNRILEQVGPKKKYRIETKDKMKKRGIKSPNKGDTLAYMLELARRHGFAWKFYHKDEYNEVYGREHYQEEQYKEAERKLGIASRILQVNWNFGSNTINNKNPNKLDVI